MTGECAVQTALVIPELLEIILDGLSSVDLLLCQRTCRQWRAVVSTSPRLQQRLFLRADWTLEGKSNKPGDRPLNNLMLRAVLDGMHPCMTLTYVQAPCVADDLADILRAEDGTSTVRSLWAWNVCVSVPAENMGNASPTVNKRAIDYEYASWRNMFLSQPPATLLHLCKRYQRSRLPALENKDGIRMGKVMARAAAVHDQGEREQIGGEVQSIWNRAYIGSDRDWHLEGPIKFSHIDNKRYLDTGIIAVRS